MSEETQVVVTDQQNSPEALISKAIDKGLTIDTLERLLVMRKDLKAEAAREAFFEAIAAFQAECPVIEKAKDVEFSGKKQYSYATMDMIVKNVKEIIARYGLSYTFKIETVSDGVKATCIVTHKMGHFETSEFVADLKGTNMMSNAQITSSKATYAKRNAFCNAFGITTGDEDNDAPKTREETKAEAAATQEQRDQIADLAKKVGLTSSEVATRFREIYGVSITSMTQIQALGTIAGLQKRLSAIPVETK